MNARRLVAIGLVVVTAAGCSWPGTIKTVLAEPGSPPAPPQVDVTGTWTGMWSRQFNRGGLELRLQQSGAKVVGDLLLHPVGPGTPLRSSVDGVVADGILRFSDQRGTVTGELTVDGDDMRGQVNATELFKVRLQRQIKRLL